MIAKKYFSPTEQKLKKKSNLISREGEKLIPVPNIIILEYLFWL